MIFSGEVCAVFWLELRLVAQMEQMQTQKNHGRMETYHVYKHVHMYK